MSKTARESPELELELGLHLHLHALAYSQLTVGAPLATNSIKIRRPKNEKIKM